MAKEQIAVAELITNIILGKTDGASRVDFFPQKTKFPFDKPYEQPFPRATPESQGISSDMLADLLRELDTSHYTDMHHFMVLRNLRGQFCPLPQPDLARDPFHVQKHHRHGNWSSG